MEKPSLELKKVINCAAFICLSCRHMALAPIYGLFERGSGHLVSIMKGHEKQFVCKQCEERIRLAEKKEERFLVMKAFGPVEIPTLVRDYIIPELIRAINEGEFKIGCKVIK